MNRNQLRNQKFKMFIPLIKKYLISFGEFARYTKYLEGVF